MKVELINVTPDAELLIAKSAGICYDSKVNKPESLLRRLKADGHLATFRFAHASFKVSEISRACANQMVRHKFLDFLQRSQRYVKETGFDYVTPPDIKEHELISGFYDVAMKNAQQMYDELIKRGIKAEDARMVLPNACHTELNVTGSFQAWWDYLYGKASRLDKHAQWEIQSVAQEIERQLNKIAPNIFGDK